MSIHNRIIEKATAGKRQEPGCGTAIDRQVGQQITAAQMHAGLSWAQLAAKSQIKASVLATFAGGTARPSGRELLRIAYALQVPISALFSSTRH